MTIDTPLEGMRALHNLKVMTGEVMDGIIADRIDDRDLRHEMKQATEIGLSWAFSADNADDIRDAMYRWYNDAYGTPEVKEVEDHTDLHEGLQYRLKNGKLYRVLDVQEVEGDHTDQLLAYWKRSAVWWRAAATEWHKACMKQEEELKAKEDEDKGRNIFSGDGRL